MVQLKVSCKKRHKLEVCRKLLFSEPSTFLQLGVCSNTKTSLSTVSNDHFEKTGGGDFQEKHSGALQSTIYKPRRRKPIRPLAVLRVKPCCLPWKGGEAAEGWALQATPPRRKPIQGMTVFSEAQCWTYSGLPWKEEPSEMCKLLATPLLGCWLF